MRRKNLMTSPIAAQTPRERIIDTIVGRIKCGRANDIHAAIEGYVYQASGEVQRYYETASYAARERLIRAIERKSGVS